MAAARPIEANGKTVKTRRAEKEAEIFRLGEFAYDVTNILGLIERGDVNVRGVYIDRDEIERYCLDILKITTSGEDQTVGAMRIHVDLNHVDNLTDKDMRRPLVLANVGKGMGHIRVEDLSDSADFALIDGNHRIARAFKDGITNLIAYVVDYETVQNQCKPIDEFVSD